MMKCQAKQHETITCLTRNKRVGAWLKKGGGVGGPLDGPYRLTLGLDSVLSGLRLDRQADSECGGGEGQEGKEVCLGQGEGGVF